MSDDAFTHFLRAAVSTTIEYVPGAKTMAFAKHKDQSDPRQRYLLSEPYAETPRLWVFATKSSAKRAAEFAAQNPHASALAILEAGDL